MDILQYGQPLAIPKQKGKQLRKDKLPFKNTYMDNIFVLAELEDPLTNIKRRLLNNIMSNKVTHSKTVENLEITMENIRISTLTDNKKLE